MSISSKYIELYKKAPRLLGVVSNIQLDKESYNQVRILGEPKPFLKPTNSITQGYKVVVVPSERDVKLEIELGVVIKENSSYVSPENALKLISGYFLASDLTARRKPILGAFTDQFYYKVFNNFTPISETFLDVSEIKNPQDLIIEFEVLENGEVKEEKRFSTSDMVWTIAE